MSSSSSAAQQSPQQSPPQAPGAAHRPLIPAREGLGALVQYAILAPSTRDTQPWHFRLDGDALEVRVDRTRALPAVDPAGRELVMSCAAALAFLRVAIHSMGHEAEVARLPSAADPDLVARVRLGARRERSEWDMALFAAIRQRRTNRRDFEPQRAPADLLAAIVDTARAEHASLRVVTAREEKEAVAMLVAEGARRQVEDPAVRRELARDTDERDDSIRGGMPPPAGGVDAGVLPFPWSVPSTEPSGRLVAVDRRLAREAPALLVLATATDTPDAWLHAGEALALVLLHLTVEGLSASFLNQPIEVAALRGELARTLGMRGHVPQLMLRIGFGPTVPPTARRALADVMLP